MDSPPSKRRIIDPIQKRLFKLNAWKVFLWVSAIVLPFCIFVWVTSGCFYMLMRRSGGIFLSTLPTFFISAAASGIYLYSVLSIIHHSKIMPDKKRQFLRIRRYSRKTALYLLTLVIPIGVFEKAMLECGLDLFSFLAVGKNFALWRPEMASLAKMPFDIEAMPFDVGDMLFGILIALFVVPALVCVLYFFRLKRLSCALCSFFIFFWAFFLFAVFAGQYFPGAMKYDGEIISAIQDPARFNSMALTIFAIPIFIFSFGTAMLMTAFTPSKAFARAGTTKTNR